MKRRVKSTGVLIIDGRKFMTTELARKQMPIRSNGKYYTRSSVVNWINDGRKGVKLEARLINDVWYVPEDAIEPFIKKAFPELQSPSPTAFEMAPVKTMVCEGLSPAPPQAAQVAYVLPAGVEVFRSESGKLFIAIG